MATKKSKTTKKPKASSAKSKTATKTAVKSGLEAPKTKTVEETKVNTKKSCFAGFFAKKYEEKESILTIFKNHKLLSEFL